ncbi:preprotein translocase subunit Sec61beta [Methanofollis sp. W23]|uniref:preprotein translocase subunit Sec61beta n=1 Tax=Methanofollis sp. W23 TaxID=2817849 RepID=UPI001AE8B487|nr:preprotein translocase subunit Sec61beta [Methanofollis sp. W23]MBP2145698.1 preprotein translocase subunit Sec61beta [Methanofollis sp. W23]
MAKKSGGRLVSSAGLVNYYDSESRRAFHINPMYVLAIATAVGVFILLLDLFY